jgi:hypothetical protein
VKKLGIWMASKQGLNEEAQVPEHDLLYNI